MKKVLLAACLACAAFTAAAAFSACVTEEEHVHDMTTHEAVAANAQMTETPLIMNAMVAASTFPMRRAKTKFLFQIPLCLQRDMT